MTHPALVALSERTGERLDEIERWADAGLLRVDEPDTALLERMRIVQVLRRRGLDIDALAAATHASPGLFDRYINVFAPRGELYALNDAAAAHGLDPDLVQRLFEASGLTEQGNLGDVDDVAALGAIAAALKAGLPADALVQLMRVYADALSRVAEAEARLLHFHVHEQPRADGITGDELDELDALTAAGIDELLPLIEPAVAYFHRKALGRAVREDLALHLAEDAGLIFPGDTSGQVNLAIAFVDLARFTPMTEAMGDVAAADILDRFSELVRREVLAGGGRVVKQIGDEFMLVFHDPIAAVRTALDIRRSTEREPAFLATRIGVHMGSVVCRAGDYFGATVNVAARITSHAAAHQVLVSAVVAEGAASLDDIAVTRVGSRTLKGIDDEVELYEAELPAGRDSSGHRIDPVCGMLVNADAAPARLQVGGDEVVFCSEGCLRRYVAELTDD